MSEGCLTKEEESSGARVVNVSHKAAVLDSIDLAHRVRPLERALGLQDTPQRPFPTAALPF
jgi:hypothetical protein